MSNTVYKRTLAVVAAIIFIAFLILSPAAELYGEHNHSCCLSDCLICLVANALSDLRTSFVAVFCAADIFIYIYICEQMRRREMASCSSSPIVLKTKITS